jgi:hypothetical protein
MTARTLMAAALLAAPATALPAPVPASLDVLYVPSATSEASSAVFLSAESEGDGYGLRGVLRPLPRLFFQAELQRNTYRSEDSDIEGSVARLGVGTPLVLREAVEFYGLAEVLLADFADRKADLEIINEGGVGLHLGFTAGLTDLVTLQAQAGVLKLDDSDGREFLAGIATRLDGPVSLVVEYRRSAVDSIMGLGTAERVNYVFSEVRVAARFHFGAGDRP